MEANIILLFHAWPLRFIADADEDLKKRRKKTACEYTHPPGRSCKDTHEFRSNIAEITFGALQQLDELFFSLLWLAGRLGEGKKRNRGGMLPRIHTGRYQYSISASLVLSQGNIDSFNLCRKTQQLKLNQSPYDIYWDCGSSECSYIHPFYTFSVLGLQGWLEHISATVGRTPWTGHQYVTRPMYLHLTSS